ncbi:MAG: hypothetical protein JKY65_11150 [Planctomycetes bacterium]|nr:hypothetical protein [Planctomycetota bacterium]
MRPRLFVSILLLVLTLGASTLANADDAQKRVKATLGSEHDALAPATRTTLVLRLAIKPGWHVYWQNPGDSGVPTQVTLTLPKGVTCPGVRWPAPKRLTHEDGSVDFAYEGQLVLLIPLEVEPKWVGKTVPLKVNVNWLVCKEICIAGEASLDLTLPVWATPSERKLTKLAPLAKATRRRLPRPLPKGARASFRGLTLNLSAPDARGLTWFPLVPEAEGPTNLNRLTSTSARLAVTYPAGVRQSKRVRGLLAIRGKTLTTYHWVELPSPKP